MSSQSQHEEDMKISFSTTAADKHLRPNAAISSNVSNAIAKIVTDGQKIYNLRTESIPVP